jgi:Na+/H+ antiporter NhaD/arsenite permease-like protein
MSFSPEFALFAFVLLGVAVFHAHVLTIAITGLAALIALKSVGPDFHLLTHLGEESGLLANLAGLLLGFAALARHFQDSRLPLWAARYLPGDWKGPLLLLVMVFVLSAFLDNIASALIGGAVARSVFRDRLHLGYLAAIVAASNAGGAGSVLGDTTTTMLWIAGVPASQVLHAGIGSSVALVFLGIPASLRQHRFQPVVASDTAAIAVDWLRVAAVTSILAAAVGANAWLGYPALGVWIALLAWAPWVKLPWREIPRAAYGALFLCCLVLIASLMPVESLPAATWHSTLGLGFVSAFFDNIPLTKLALDQAGYDWGLLAYAVGVGGSMLWFGSSAGVALSGDFPALKSTLGWMREGWFILPAYLAGFLAQLALGGWHPMPLPGP